MSHVFPFSILFFPISKPTQIVGVILMMIAILMSHRLIWL